MPRSCTSEIAKDFVLNLAGKALRDVAALSSQAATALGAR
jgi:hypothetical protein